MSEGRLAGLLTSGWVRLFVVLAVIWITVVAVLFLKDVFIYALIPIALLFLAIFGIKWIRDGFKKVE